MFVIYLCVAWLIGLWFADTLMGQEVSAAIWMLAGFLGFVGAVFVPRREQAIRTMLLCLFALCAGGARVAMVGDVRCDGAQVCGLNGQPRDVTLVGWVAGEPDVRDAVVNLRVRVTEATVRNLAHPDGLTQAMEGDVLVSVPRFPVIAYGSVVTVTGALNEPFESAEFSYRDYLAREGIYSTMYLPRIRVGASNQGWKPLAAIYQLKSSAADTIEQLIPAPASGLLKAIMLGDKSGLPDQLEDDFRTVGLSHLIAISGFHVSIILILVLGVLDVGFRPKTAAIITIVVLILYAVLVGLRPSVIRATFMGIGFLIGTRFLGRRNNTISILASIAIGITLINPDQITNVGFQLSFAATLSLALYGQMLATWLKNWVHNNLFEPNAAIKRLLNILAITLAAQILTLPIVAYHFEQVALVSLLANLIVVPVQPILMIIGVLATLIGSAFLPLGKLVGWVAWLLLTFTIRAVELLAQIPFASVPIQVNEFTLIFTYVMIGAMTWYLYQEAERRAETRKRLRLNVSQPVMAGVSVMGLFLAISWSSGQPDGLLHVSFLDVGQGDAIFVETPTGRQILIDGGEFPTLLNSEIGRKLPFWDREIDLVIATHPDADHVTGLPEIFDRYRVQRFIYDGQTAAISGVYGAVWERIEAQDVETYIAQAGEVIEVEDGVRLEIVHPSGTLDEDIRNNNSVSLRLVYGEFSLLLTGDAEVEAERAMLATGLPLASVVYKAGHHGSQTSSSADFMNAINPQIVIISAGVDNQFGHPHPDVIGRFNASGAAVLDTRLHGTIEVKTDGEQMWWTGNRKAVRGER